MQLWGPKHTRDKISFLPASIEGSLFELRGSWLDLSLNIRKKVLGAYESHLFI